MGYIKMSGTSLIQRQFAIKPMEYVFQVWGLTCHPEEVVMVWVHVSDIQVEEHIGAVVEVVHLCGSGGELSHVNQVKVS